MMPYELLCCFQYSNEPEGTLPPGMESVLSAIQKYNGTVASQGDMGVRRLAYPIKHKSAGHYVLLQCALEPSAIAPLNAMLTIEPTLLRHQLLRYVKTQSPRPMVQRQKKIEEPPVYPAATTAPEQPRPAAMSAEELDKSIERILEEKVL